MAEERLWCKACGTVTRDRRCDCNRWGPAHEMYREPQFVNYADALQETINAQAEEIVRLKSERLKLDRRIHNQRVALRENWEIIEMRASHKRAWLQSPLLRSMLHRKVSQSNGVRTLEGK